MIASSRTKIVFSFVCFTSCLTALFTIYNSKSIAQSQLPGYLPNDCSRYPILFEHDNFRGRRYYVPNSNISNLHKFNFGDKASSLCVPASWTLYVYEDINCKGTELVYNFHNRGRVDKKVTPTVEFISSLRPDKFNDEISSVIGVNHSFKK